jgi:hypothetical protein
MRPGTRRRSGRATLFIVGAALAVLALSVGLWAFQPWRLYTSHTVDEALPTALPNAAPAGAEAPGAPGAQPGGNGQAAPGGQAQPAPVPPAPAAQPVVLAQGDFVSQEHGTSGVAKIIKLGDGSRLLRLENFSTSDGPDVHVWLADQPAGGGWHIYDDGRHVSLGKLKGTDGNQNYPIPPDVDLAGLQSVVIWCDRFNVAFGSAPLPA